MGYALTFFLGILFVANGYLHFIQFIFLPINFLLKLGAFLSSVLVPLYRSPALAFLFIYIPCRAFFPKVLLLSVTGLPDFSIHQVIAIVIFTFFFVKEIIQFRFINWRITLIDLVIIGYLLTIFTSEVINDGFREAQFRVRQVLLDQVIIYIMARNFIETQGYRVLFLRTFIYTHLLLVAVLLYDFRYMTEFLNDVFQAGISPRVQSRWGYRRVLANYGHPITCGIIYGQVYILYQWITHWHPFNEQSKLSKTTYMFVMGTVVAIIPWVISKLSHSPVYSACVLILLFAILFYSIKYMFFDSPDKRSFQSQKFPFFTFFLSKRFLSPFSLVLFAGLVLPISRGPWVNFSVLFFILWAALTREKWKIFLLGTILFFGAVMPFQSYRKEQIELGQTGIYRHKLKSIFMDIKEEGGWFGHGIVNSRLVIIEHGYYYAVFSIDDAALFLHVNHGRMALIMYYLLLFLPFWYGFIYLLTHKRTEDSTLVVLFMGLSLNFYYNLKTVWLSPEMAYFYFLILGWMSGFYRQQKLKKKAAPQLHPAHAI